VTRERLRLYQLPQKEVISRSVDILLSEIHQQKDPTRTATELYSSLLSNIPETLKKSRIIVIPDGVLTKVPFEVLVGPQGRSLLESHVLTYAPSATVLTLLRQNVSVNAQKMTILAVAGSSEPSASAVTPQARVQPGIYDVGGASLPALPAAEEEADAVAKILGGESVILKGGGANAVNHGGISSGISRYRLLDKSEEKFCLGFSTDGG
jgi:CHAT domain-containing protein